MSSSPSLSSLTPSTSASFATVEKHKLIRQQLILLIHAKKCLDEQEKAIAGGAQPEDRRPCVLPHCEDFQKILKHMEVCRVFSKCEFEYCTSSREIIKHWKQCKNTSCPICAPIRQHHQPYDPRKVVEIRDDAPHYFYQ